MENSNNIKPSDLTNITYTEIGKIELINALNDLYEKESERYMKLYTGCKTNSIIDLDFQTICNDPECKNCDKFRRLLLEKLKKRIWHF